MNKFFRSSVIFFAFVLFAGMLVSCANLSLAEDITPPPNYRPPTEAQPVAAGPTYPLVTPDPSAGAPIYVEKCAPCHGPAGRGDGPQASKLPNPVIAIGDPKVSRDASPSSWYTVITEGRLERFMPGFSGGLSDRQRWDVLAYVFTLSNPPDQVTEGKTLYDASCASCHGPLGKGDGPDAANQTDKPKDLTAPGGLTQKSAAEMFQVIRTGIQGMPGFSDKLDENQSWAITSYLRSLTFSAVPGANPSAANPTPTAAAVAANDNQPTATQDANATAAPTEATPVETTPAGTPGTPQANPIGTVRGQVNFPAGTSQPQGLKVTLNGYDANMQVVVNQVTDLKPDGTYIFEKIQMPSNVAFMASLEMNNMTFNSDVAHAQAGASEINLPISVYDTTTDKSQLVIDRMHIFLDFSTADTVQVVELFIISNPTTHVVVPAQSGQPLLNFVLPAGASNLQFQDGVLGQRYIQTKDGFGDTQSIQPGSGQHQILFAFDLPYQNKVTLTVPPPLPVTAAVVMVPLNGVKVQSPDLKDGGKRDVQNTTFQVFTADTIPEGKSITMTVSGVPNLAQTTGGTAATTNTTGLAIGGGVFAIALIGSGLWLFRRRKLSLERSAAPAAGTDAIQNDPDALIDAIAALDDLYKAGNLPQAAYQQRRAELKERLRACYQSQPPSNAG